MPARIIARRFLGRELTEKEEKLLVHVEKVLAAVVLPLLVLAVLIPVGAALYFVNDESKERTKDLALEGERRDRAIQESRARVSYDVCADQNARHDETIIALDRILEKAKRKNPERADQIAASRASTIVLLDAAIPVQDCRAIVLKRFGFLPSNLGQTGFSSSRSTS